MITNELTEPYPSDLPVFLARPPHGHGRADQIQADVQAASFTTCTLVQRDEVRPSPNARTAAVACCHGTPLRTEIEARNPDGLGRATAASAKARAGRFGDGPIQGRLTAVVISAS